MMLFIVQDFVNGEAQAISRIIVLVSTFSFFDINERGMWRKDAGLSCVELRAVMTLLSLQKKSSKETHEFRVNTE